MENEVVWVSNKSTTDSTFTTIPVPKYKIIKEPVDVNQVPDYWVPPLVEDMPISEATINKNEKINPSEASTRCEEWSTLRQMKPSTTRLSKVASSSWGCTPPNIPAKEEKTPERHPKINSSMTRYIDEMHSSNPLFKLH
ncbi:hypothetical protein TrispH2_002450 [Trichoplax sp. H2]|uniref:Uncharacterized protein n=1 Tax=Trichoplax adhaerens TaxID=10228 RepID=B3S0N3_TRIAD|nr:hypothetical protein TRIADDRAFT_57111 [Trichoplax adhaerens]EDV23670.1 hypothetical protein TRIADDRAFT_57111 [Trichoplax adhaerens]RDD44896.1 hypothetical protein TrispH2_002450 [Trichoplax sp. H2]|eukprot:XP_002113196.1 hypothetical protein TRIADDRAFT_57111 [Trichoplax adhaerens]